MNTRVHQSRQGQRRPSTDRTSGKARPHDASRRSLDHGPEIVAPSKLQEVTSDDPQVKAHAALQRLADSSPQVQRAARSQAIADRSARVAVPAGQGGARTRSALTSRVEQLSKMDLSDVRVHYDSSRPGELNAKAYAQGTDIHLAPGQQPCLAHELWHVVQQKQGRVAPTRQLMGVQINDSDALEREADVMANRIRSLDGSGPAPAQTPSASSGRPGVVQAKFGLEAELNVHLSTVPDDAHPPDLDTEPDPVDEPHIASANGFNVHLDHSMLVFSEHLHKTEDKEEFTVNNAIIELVTDPPFDETGPWGGVKAQLDNMLDAIRWLGNGLPARKNLASMPHIGAIAVDLPDGDAYRNGVYVGGTEVVGTQNNDAHLHINTGVSLTKITDYFGAISSVHGAGKDRRYEAVTDAAAVGDKIAHEQLGPLFDEHFPEPMSDRERSEMGGLFALLAQYLIGHQRSSDTYLLKNRLLPLFYKTPMPSLRKALSPRNVQFLNEADVRGNLLTIFFGELKPFRIKPTGLFVKDYSYQQWVEDVLEGRELPDTKKDKLQDDAMNDYSDPIEVETNSHGNRLFVLENRLPLVSGEERPYKVGEIEPIVKLYYDSLHKMNSKP